MVAGLTADALNSRKECIEYITNLCSQVTLRIYKSFQQKVLSFLMPAIVLDGPFSLFQALQNPKESKLFVHPVS